MWRNFLDYIYVSPLFTLTEMQILKDVFDNIEPIQN